MVSVSISHSDFIFILHELFAQMYLYWPPHRISHFELCLRPYMLYGQAVAPARSRAIKDPAPKLMGLARSPHVEFPPSLSNRDGVSVTAPKHATGPEINTPPLSRRWGPSMVPSLGAGALGCCGGSQDAAGVVFQGIYSRLFINAFSSVKFSFCGQKGESFPVTP